MSPAPHRLALKLAAGAVAGWLGLMAALLASAGLPPAASGPVLAFFPPGRDPASGIRAAGGLPLEPFAGGIAWTAASATPGFAGRLEAAGALLVLRPPGPLAWPGLCGPALAPPT